MPAYETVFIAPEKTTVFLTANGGPVYVGDSTASTDNGLPVCYTDQLVRFDLGRGETLYGMSSGARLYVLLQG